MNVYTHIGFEDAEELKRNGMKFCKAQAEVEKKSEKPILQKMFRSV
jgi:hypothetical protein